MILALPPGPLWLCGSLDEDDPLQLVLDSHRDIEDEFEDEHAMFMHATIHVVVENQLADDVDPVPETMARLTREGLDRHEAIHAIGSVLIERVFTGFRSNENDLMPKYAKKLKKLTAKRWLSGKW